MVTMAVFAALSDDALVQEVTRLVARECDATARVVGSLAVLDERRLYLKLGYASLFVYCVEALHVSESAAYHRIEAARAARRFPVILEKLASGELTLTTIRLLARHLSEENHEAVLAAAGHLSKRGVEALIARLFPEPDVPAQVRKLPAPSRSGPAAAPCANECARRADSPAVSVTAPLLPPDACTVPASAPALPPPPPRQPASAIVRPLAPERYKVQMTVSAETHAKLRRAQDLLRRVVPDGDPAVVFDRALTVLIEHLERTRRAATRRHRPAKQSTSSHRRHAAGEPPAGTPHVEASVASPRSASSAPACRKRSRHIPADVRRAVWKRDGAQCSYVGENGHRCAATGRLEVHHKVPFALGGESTVENLAVFCASHNAAQAVCDFGSVADHRRQIRPNDSNFLRSKLSEGEARAPGDP